jgi:hypothetical protein
MACSAPSKTQLGLPRENVEEMLMHEAIVREGFEFEAEFKEKGYSPLLAEVRERKTFEESFDKLVSKGCAPDVLFLGLYSLLRTAKQQMPLQLPGKREIRSLETCLHKGVEGILAFEKKYEGAYRTMDFLRDLNAGRPESDFYRNGRDLPSEAKTRGLTEQMLAYAEILRAWWTPRSDAIHAYASVHNCVYAKMVTGRAQFSIVAKLNTSFLGSHINADTLRKNLSRFERRYREFNMSLLAGLNEAHYTVLPLGSAKPVDWPTLFGTARRTIRR